MLKTKSLFILVLLALFSLTANLNAQLNETFNGITYGIPNGWDNSDYLFEAESIFGEELGEALVKELEKE